MEARPTLGAGAEENSGARIRSRERVRDLAEVYTDERDVNAMLDLVSGMFPTADDPDNTDCSFLEPTCGSGNFLVEILRRKLYYVTASRYGHRARLEHRILRCLASIYGIDICDQNVAESRARMAAVSQRHLEGQLAGEVPTPGFTSAVRTMLTTNIVCADTLANAADIEFVEYEPVSSESFIREWSRPLDPASGELNLFAPAGGWRDEAPVHYSELAFQPKPVGADRGRQEAA